jgi:hypothetical protein
MDFAHAIHKFEDFTPASEALIVLFERYFARAKLPADYRRFLEQCNGGNHGGEFSFTSEDNPDDSSSVDCFYGLCPLNEHQDLFCKFDSLQDCLPRTCIPIAVDGLGNHLLLELGEKNFGAVLFRNHERVGYEPLDTHEPYEGISLVAASFTDFLKMLNG